MPPAVEVLTVGHSTRSAEELVELLRSHDAALLVDVRTIPRSRHNPQFEREALQGTLTEAGIAYRHEPGLGGLRKPSPDSINMGWKNASFRGYADHMQTPQFARLVDALLEQARKTRTALMCAEAVPWRCHRSLIADALSVRGAEVSHIFSAKQKRPHRLAPFARVEGRRISYPGLF